MVLLREFRFPDTVSGAAREQERLASRLRLRPLPLDRIRVVGAADVTFLEAKERVAAALVLFDRRTGRVLEERTAVVRTSFPYVPGYLTFREGPAVLAAWARLSGRPDAMLFDGQGIAHPRGFGIAAHLGVLLGVPSVGCAKKRLVGEAQEPGPGKGDRSVLYVKGSAVGTVLRTREGVRPVFVSPGHLADRESSAELVLSLCSRYRIPDPLRLAHRLTRELRSDLAARTP